MTVRPLTARERIERYLTVSVCSHQPMQLSWQDAVTVLKWLNQKRRMKAKNRRVGFLS